MSFGGAVASVCSGRWFTPVATSYSFVGAHAAFQFGGPWKVTERDGAWEMKADHDACRLRVWVDLAHPGSLF